MCLMQNLTLRLKAMAMGVIVAIAFFFGQTRPTQPHRRTRRLFCFKFQIGLEVQFFECRLSPFAPDPIKKSEA